jgi:hypothetical protein
MPPQILVPFLCAYLSHTCTPHVAWCVFVACCRCEVLQAVWPEGAFGRAAALGLGDAAVTFVLHWRAQGRLCGRFHCVLYARLRHMVLLCHTVRRHYKNGVLFWLR